MRLPLGAALLASCAERVPVAVPSDPMILHGRSLGTSQERLEDGLGKTVAAQLTAAPSDVSQAHYRASGTLNVAGQTYTFTGVGTGSLMEFTARWNPASPSITFQADLRLRGEKVGLLMWNTGRPTPPGPLLYVALNNQPHELRLSREP